MQNTTLGIIATCFTTLAFLPQVIKTVKTQDTQSISTLFACIKSVCSLLWTFYGIMIANAIIIISCQILFVCSSIILGYKLKNVILNKENL